MDRRSEEAPTLGSFPQIRRKLSADGFPKLEHDSRTSEDESIKLSLGVHRSGRNSSASGDLEQASYGPQAGQTILAQLSNNEQIKHDHESRKEKAQMDQAPNDEQTQTEQESSDHTKIEAQQNQKSSHDCEHLSRPPLVPSKTGHLGRVGDWTWEIFSMAVALCCLLIIFIILAKFDHQEQPEWPYARTLNLSTLIAVLATILRSMLENVLNAGLGQLKWRWFQTSSRPLDDMNTYEDASRGVWGSVVFLFSLPRK